jgi:hypothetical protein
MSTTALYYPNVTIVAPRQAGQSQNYNQTDLKLLTTAMLLWDELEVIVPYRGFQPEPVIGENQMNEEHAIRKAFEMVVKPRALSDDELYRLFNELKTLISKGVPDTLRFKLQVDNYNMYPEKLSPAIWEYLKEAGLTGDGSMGYYGLQRDFALILMGLIAEICAGGTRIKVTNYRDAHAAFSHLVATQNGIVPDYQPAEELAPSTLVSISLKAVDAGRFPLDKLIQLRQREQEDGLLPPLRRNYRAAVDKYVERIRKEAKSKVDMELIEREFELEIRDDFRHLQEMMRLEFGDTIITKGVAILTAISKQDVVGAVGPLLNLPSFKLKKQQILEKHQSAWLYSV